MSIRIEQGGESCPEDIAIPVLKLLLVKQNQEKNALILLCVASHPGQVQDELSQYHMMLPASVQAGLPPEPSYHPGSAGPLRMVPIMVPQSLSTGEGGRERGPKTVTCNQGA